MDKLGVGPLTGRPLHTLSGGQLQRMYLARAVGCVAAGAGVLLADEPTAALDFAGQARVGYFQPEFAGHGAGVK